MRVWVIGSGSSGNAALVESRGERILIDAGIGPQRAAGILSTMGVDLFPSGVSAIVVTHEHDDHAAKLEPLARALRAPVFLHDGIAAPRVRERFPVVRFSTMDAFHAGAFVLRARAVPHDAPQVALRIEAHGRALGWVTDIGHVPATFPVFFEGCQTVLLEANYDAEMLEQGPYPPRLRARVGGPIGHLDNRDAAKLVASLASLGVEHVKLAHLSAVNNSPERVLRAVRERQPDLPVEVVPYGACASFDVTPTRRATQLALF